MKLILFTIITLFSSFCSDASDEKLSKAPKKHRSLPEEKFPLDHIDLNIPGCSHLQNRSKSPSQERSKSAGEKKSSGRKRKNNDVKVIAYSEEPIIILPEEAQSLIKNQKSVCENSGNYYGAQKFEFSTIFSLLDKENYCSFLNILSPRAKRITLPEVSFLTDNGEQIVQFILDNKLYHCLIQDENDTTVLDIATRRHDLKIIKEILPSSQQMLWIITAQGNTIFHALFLDQRTRKKSTPELIDYLHKYSQFTNDLMLNHQNKEGDTPLHLACKICNIRGIQSLICKSVKFDIQNLNEKSALDILFRHYFSLKKDLNETKAPKKKRAGLLNIIGTMLNKDALLTYKSKKKGNSPLHIAIQREYKQLLLVLAKTKILQDSQNKSGDTPVHHAIKKGMLHYLPLLCIGNKSLNLKNNDGLTSLDILFHTLFKELPKSDEEQKKKIEIHHTLVSYVALLLENGADPNSYCDEKENNALYLAVETNNPKLVALLIQHGIDACKKNKNEETALHRAIRNMEINQDIVLSLFQNVELLQIPDKDGHTPYNLIQQNIHWVEIFDKARKQKNKTS